MIQVMDWGLARSLDQGSPFDAEQPTNGTGNVDFKLTVPGRAFGTLPYMPQSNF